METNHFGSYANRLHIKYQCPGAEDQSRYDAANCEIEIYPEYLNEYKEILKKEAAASIKKEAGVIAIFPMLKQRDSTQIRIIEIYANKDAYQSQLKTPNFQYYKTSTQKMVKTLNLVEMDALDQQVMLEIKEYCHYSNTPVQELLHI